MNGWRSHSQGGVNWCGRRGRRNISGQAVLDRFVHFVRRKPMKTWLLIGAVACTLPRPGALAQTVTLGEDVSRPIPGRGHDYIHLVNETVDPANGILTSKIEGPAAQGGG